ncbi:MAG: carbamoyltransferase HypF [Sporichthyaceae bacterium]
MTPLSDAAADPGGRGRVRSTVRGVVQGVGMRPFVYALARDLALAGSVGNTADGVVIEVEGPRSALAAFAARLRTDAPPLARIESVVTETMGCRGGTGFVIVDSAAGQGRTLISPDIATCEDCLAELSDPADRRFAHPFISCTNCGPRFTIVVDLPYDRPATTMAALPLCSACAAEYADPSDRRFHAQTVACRDCGPRLTLHQPGLPDEDGDAALRLARELLAGGAILAVKGLGGYHLACDAGDPVAVATLRKRKDRGDKPFAVMVPDLAAAAAIAHLSAAERELLADPRRPVVLAARRGRWTGFAGPDAQAGAELAAEVAPGSPDVGLFLPYTPVHHLLFARAPELPGPRALVMTSGNLAGEPIVIDDAQARTRLVGLADAWLCHDRPIHVPCDDSVLRVADDRELPVRRSRGYAPLPLALAVPVRAALAVGGDLKNTFALAQGGYAWLSAHVGDMDDLATLAAFEVATVHLSAVTGVQPELVIADQHPGYRSAAWARRCGLPFVAVQHHHAHLASAMAENGYDGAEPVIGFAFDGTGYGTDGAAWGGEVLLADYEGFTRAAHLRYTWLPGGDAGVRNPCRMALSHLHAAGIAWDPRLPSVAACNGEEISVLGRQVESGLACVRTSSLGRLFDAVSSLAGVCHRIAYEAEAAMRFEGLARGALAGCGAGYAFGVEHGAGADPDLLDPSPVLAAVVEDVVRGVAPAVIAARFHLAVVDLVVAVAVDLRARTGLGTVALSGGVFLNALLSTLCAQRLAAQGFRCLRHRIVPPSDAGLALGQLAIAARRSHLAEEPTPCA